MADEEPVYQFLVTGAEMKLLHTLRGIVPEEETAENRAKLQSAVHLMAYAGDRHLGDFSVDGNTLVTGLADVGAQIRDKLLHDKAESGAQDDRSVDDHFTTASATEVINDVFMDEPVPWDEVRSQVIPSYVHNIMFTVSKDDMNDEHRKELAERFPDVIVQESGSNRSAKRQAAPEHPVEKPAGVKNAVFDLTKECSATMEADIRNQYPWARLKPFTHALNRIQQVLDANAENTPAATPATSPTVDGPRSLDTDRKPNITTPTGPRSMSLASRTTWGTLLSENDSTDFFDLTKVSDISDLCQRIGLENVRADYIAAVYKYWLRSGQIREFLPGKMLLQYYYITLVDTYTLAHASKNEELEYAILLQFQVTNFEQPEELPFINKSVVRAFKYLPSQSPLCKWIAILYSCLNMSSIYDGDYDEFIKKNKLADPIALGKFVYGVASVPHPRRWKHEWLERWCSVHDHVPDSDDDHRCMKAERSCKNILLTGVSPGVESSDRLTKKRSLDSASGYNKKFKPNDSYSRGR